MTILTGVSVLVEITVPPMPPVKGDSITGPPNSVPQIRPSKRGIAHFKKSILRITSTNFSIALKIISAYALLRGGA
jgi:hypothetical protein